MIFDYFDDAPLVDDDRVAVTEDGFVGCLVCSECGIPLRWGQRCPAEAPPHPERDRRDDAA